MQKLITYLLNNNIQFIITNKQIITYPTSSPTWEKLMSWTPNTIDIDLPNDDVTITCIPLTDLPTS
jgi:hypothetical protein